MPAKLAHHHILLYPGDFDRLKNIYTNISPSYIIRELVRKHVEAAEARYKEIKRNAERVNTG